MDEVDSAIIKQLQEVGCPIDEEKVTIAELEADEIIVCAAKCLAAIFEGDAQLAAVSASNLNMATKYKVATHLAEKSRELGFKGELGYQTFLYGTGGEIRKLFLFLLEKMPRDNATDEVETTATDDQSVLARLRRANISLTWLPPMEPDALKHRPQDYLESKNLRGLFNSKSILGNKMAPNRKAFYDQNARIHLNCGSLMEWNCSQLNAAHSVKQVTIEINKEETIGEPMTRKDTLPGPEILVTSVQDEAVENTQTYEERLQARIEELEANLETKDAERSRILVRCEQLKASVEKFEKETALEKDKLLEMRSQDKTIDDLKTEATAQTDEMQAMKEQWAEIESSLKEQINDITQDNESRIASLSSNRIELDDIARMASSKSKEMKEKETLIHEIMEKMPEPMPPGRNLYTKRIIEVVNNVKKQNHETSKVLLETRALQKEINSLQGKVQRAFTVSDESIFREAKSSEWHKRCYKLLAAMREHCDQVTDGITEMGLTKRDILKLEETMEKEQFKLIGSNLVRIQADLKQLQIENQKLGNMKSAIAKQNQV